MVPHYFIRVLSSTATTTDSTVVAALIAAIASCVVSIISMISTIIGWIITNNQQKKQYIRDFDVGMFKEILPALYALADETKLRIEGSFDKGWIGFDDSVVSVEKLYHSYSPFIISPIREQIVRVINGCKDKKKETIDSGMEELIDQVSRYTNSLIMRS